MVSRDDIRDVVIRVGDKIVDPNELASAIADEVVKLLESPSKDARFVRTIETR
jgi:hypothetical protein